MNGPTFEVFFPSYPGANWLDSTANAYWWNVMYDRRWEVLTKHYPTAYIFHSNLKMTEDNRHQWSYQMTIS